MEDIENGDHDQHVQAAADEALRNPKPDEQPSSRCERNRLETCPDQPSRRLVFGRSEADATLDPDSRQECGCREKHSGTTDEDHADICKGDEHACQ